MPTKQIPLFRKFEWSRRLKFDSRALLDFDPKPIHSPLFKYVLQSRMFAIGAIAKIPMNRDYRFGHIFKMLRRQKADHISQTRESLRISLRHTHASASQQIVSRNFAVL